MNFSSEATIVIVKLVSQLRGSSLGMESEFKVCFGIGVCTVWKKMKKSLSDIILFNFKGLLEYPEAT